MNNNIYGYKLKVYSGNLLPDNLYMVKNQILIFSTLNCLYLCNFVTIF